MFRPATVFARSRQLLAGCTDTKFSKAIREASHVSPLTMGKLHPLWTAQVGAKRMSHVPNYEEKYREKLLEKAKAEGVSTIEELKHKVIKDRDEPSNMPESESTKAMPKISSSAKKAEKKPLRRAKSDGSLPPNVKTLDQIMRLDLLESKDAEEIGHIWNQYHATKDTISAAIPGETYQRLLEVARKNPLFVLPLPRNQGVEFFFLQLDHHQVHFTSLIEYKTNTVNARPYLTLTHYTDLIESKGLVLMRGELDSESNLIDTQNAQYLALQMQQFYVTGGPEKRAVLENFNQRPELFNYEELIELAQKL
ncbi:hypothetical protein LPJ64_001598 [Coemansia asiatica]|uniref:ATP synthase mitochondrial F1 complex assembly factor 1 n=1 Tax=Coemansia asiatica TaxID=1052880 RepID=A0A9W8CLB8_9FUNG|nr:hypothetical protein LPJ64_001598 [Coemansia asiatica]